MVELVTQVTLQSKVAELEGRIASLEKRVKNLENNTIKVVRHRISDEELSEMISKKIDEEEKEHVSHWREMWRHFDLFMEGLFKR